MPSYRFCRPDDVPRLVEGVNRCFDVHFPDREPLTVERYRREMKEIDLWPSNSMLALEGDEAVAVLTATKREDEVAITRVGVHPERLREGHGSHLVVSLGQKLAVLGPERLVAELPEEMEEARAFFAACGYEEEAVFTDWEWRGSPHESDVPEGLLQRVSIAELDAAGVLDDPAGAPLERTRRTLLQRGDRLRALAAAGPERVEAWAAYLPPEETGGDVEVWGLGVSEPERRQVWLRILLERLGREGEGASPVVLRQLGSGEIPEATSGELALSAARRWIRASGSARAL